MAVPEALAACYVREMTRGHLLLHLGQLVSPAISARRGVRQGCPLAPRLFRWVMEDTVLPLQAAWRSAGHSLRIGGTAIDVLMWADDALLFACNSPSLGHMLQEVSHAGRAVGLELNPAKCTWLSYNEGVVPHTHLPDILLRCNNTTAASGFTVLGCWISCQGDYSAEFQRRLNAAWRCFYAYSAYWRPYGLLGTRLRMLHAILVPTLLWGAGSRPWLHSQLSRLSSIQLSMGRRLLHSWIRAGENFIMYLQRSADQLRDHWQQQRLVPWSFLAATRQWTWAGHVARMVEDADSFRAGKTLLELLEWRDWLWCQFRKGINGALGRRGHSHHVRWETQIAAFVHHEAHATWKEVARDRVRWRRLTTTFALRACRFTAGWLRCAPADHTG